MNTGLADVTIKGDEAKDSLSPQESLDQKYPSKFMDMLQAQTIMDDLLGAKILDDETTLTEVLTKIIEKPLQVVRREVQKTIPNLQGRGVRLDILAQDKKGKLYNIEVQRDDRGAVPQRARYNGAIIDSNFLPKGEDFEKLLETYIIFITENDVLKGDYQAYHIERMVQETGRPFNDGMHIIYVNASKQEDSELGRLAHDLTCADPEQMYSKILAERMKLFKFGEGVQEMLSTYDALIAKGKEIGREEGREEGEKKKAREMSIGLCKKGVPIKTIAEVANTTVETIQKWLKETEAAG